MSRYIDADLAIKAIENDCSEVVFYTKQDAIDCIQATPTADVVEVVRCKDCVARCNTKLEPFRCERNNILVYGNSFCVYGKRRE